MGILTPYKHKRRGEQSQICFVITARREIGPWTDLVGNNFRPGGVAELLKHGDGVLFYFLPCLEYTLFGSRV
jgi:hypothetical protein